MGPWKRPPPPGCYWASPGATAARLLQSGASSHPLSHPGSTAIGEMECVSGQQPRQGQCLPVNFPSASKGLGARKSPHRRPSHRFLYCELCLWDNFACITMRSVSNWEQAVLRLQSILTTLVGVLREKWTTRKYQWVNTSLITNCVSKRQ